MAKLVAAFAKCPLTLSLSRQQISFIGCGVDKRRLRLTLGATWLGCLGRS